VASLLDREADFANFLSFFFQNQTNIPVQKPAMTGTQMAAFAVLQPWTCLSSAHLTTTFFIWLVSIILTPIIITSVIFQP